MPPFFVSGVLNIFPKMGVMFQFVCPKRDPHFKDDPKLSVFFHTMINTNHIFIKSIIGAC